MGSFFHFLAPPARRQKIHKTTHPTTASHHFFHKKILFALFFKILFCRQAIADKAKSTNTIAAKDKSIAQANKDLKAKQKEFDEEYKSFNKEHQQSTEFIQALRGAITVLEKSFGDGSRNGYYHCGSIFFLSERMKTPKSC